VEVVNGDLFCPSRDFGNHIFENGICAMCYVRAPDWTACTGCGCNLHAPWPKGYNAILCKKCADKEERNARHAAQTQP
jgi:hypothetical protein